MEIDEAGCYTRLGYGLLSDRDIRQRAVGYFLWVFGVLLLAWLIGVLPALFLFVLAFLRFHGKESWPRTLLVSVGIFAFVWILFDQILHEAWPQTVIGDLVPGLRGRLHWF